MTNAIRDIVIDFEAAALRAVAAGGDASDIEQARDDAVDNLRALKAGADGEMLEAIFAAALEIGTKAGLAIEAVRK
ncbi:hypothetical protein [Bradyrhizobium sp. USDA 223]|uniref:hypothetical protein n=1 Tax=Bradyrhizobium sp. USDA 223 TaxID=3156306 RepID=UPI003833CD64